MEVFAHITGVAGPNRYLPHLPFFFVLSLSLSFLAKEAIALSVLSFPFSALARSRKSSAREHLTLVSFIPSSQSDIHSFNSNLLF